MGIKKRERLRERYDELILILRACHKNISRTNEIPLSSAEHLRDYRMYVPKHNSNKSSRISFLRKKALSRIY